MILEHDLLFGESEFIEAKVLRLGAGREHHKEKLT